MYDPWDLKSQMLDAIKEKGGFVNCHAHIDKSFYITKENLSESMVMMEQKWRMSDNIKQHDTQQDVEKRITEALRLFYRQGVRMTQSFIDAYDVTGHKAIDAARKMQEKYKQHIRLITATQPLGGLLDPDAIALYEAITEKADIAGGLPSFDRPYDNKSFDTLFSIAKNLNKPIHIHIDQENNPYERDTEKVIYYTQKYGYEGRVTVVHAISISAQPKEYRTTIYKKMADLGIAVVVCPSAAISMPQHDTKIANVHNSIANIPEMLEHGVLVGLGVDDISDFYLPFVDADMWVETRMLMEACRFYDFDAVVDICTVNGRKILERT
ncbi:MAG: hypothetical protein COU32_01675 [Candidatus Magasanikbacteria bacterium CG10_big_fil_rev_8_21_14_0_10_42_10]|uniref:Amidohydrolase-related domain-containing protein n=2 Tax=Candidatus Magasanikiibacteriota TaxID=1752731 RepID=A0A2H0TWK5_9BACT|nr:MAG: hypothetical protein COU32_01675 [Candidatus Magasanikbacteria bacterium CG10_big_fil_rev_8_21_14_0_10_42_10]PIZ94485.1 MAG: hypothetical protein COX82_00570 [Candidatus Magasanikbacteria bacterium CG_4_10_14_0_2_um_filter_41_10]